MNSDRDRAPIELPLAPPWKDSIDATNALQYVEKWYNSPNSGSVVSLMHPQQNTKPSYHILNPIPTTINKIQPFPKPIKRLNKERDCP